MYSHQMPKLRQKHPGTLKYIPILAIYNKCSPTVSNLMSCAPCPSADLGLIMQTLEHRGVGAQPPRLRAAFPESLGFRIMTPKHWGVGISFLEQGLIFPLITTCLSPSFYSIPPSKSSKGFWRICTKLHKGVQGRTPVTFLRHS
jgi:hypothetical protein